MKWILFLILTTRFIYTADAAMHRNAFLELLPGESTSAEVKKVLGKPVQSFSERGAREYWFFDRGDGPTSLSAVALKSGVVEYVSFLCEEKLGDVLKRYAGVQSQERDLVTELMGRKGKLKQIAFESEGRGFVYEPHSKKIKACLIFKKGKTLDSLGS